MGHDHPGRRTLMAAAVATGLRLIVGRGSSLLPGCVNLDNSLTARLAQFPVLGQAFAALLQPAQRTFMARARANGILSADAIHLPFPDRSVALVYSSHMIEH